MAIGKTLRFEIFARDQFTCQYCGRRPPDVVLELDHLHPRSKGGSDDPINLVTSCFDCNRGKRDKVLGEIPQRPDADIAFLKVQQELGEAKRYLAAKRKLDAANKKICDALRASWSEYLTECVPSDRVLIPWISRYGPQEVEACIKCAIPAFQKRFGWGSDESAFRKLLPYVGAILRNRAIDRESGAIQ